MKAIVQDRLRLSRRAGVPGHRGPRGRGRRGAGAGARGRLRPRRVAPHDAASRTSLALMPGFRKMWPAPGAATSPGVVEAVGANVTDFQPGRRGDGRSSRAPSPSSRVGRSDKLVPQAGQHQLRAGRRRSRSRASPPSRPSATSAKVQPGQKVLVIGAAGGVGTLAVQIAKAFGARGHRRVQHAKADLVRSLGADDVIDYTREDFTDGTRRWDVIVDTAGRRPLGTLRRALTPRGPSRSSAATAAATWTGGFFRQILRAPLLSLFTGQRMRPVISKENREDLETLRALVEAGR